MTHLAWFLAGYLVAWFSIVLIVVFRHGREHD